MAHIHTEPGQYDHTVSAFIIRTDSSEPKVMLHLHKKHGTYLQFGGHIELDETPWQAITHELVEEAGYDLDQLSILQPAKRLTHLSNDAIVHPHPVSHNTHIFNDNHAHIDITYVMIASSIPRHKPAEDESTDIRLFTRSELLALSNEQILENVREIALYILDEIFGYWEEVPTSAFK
jgi:8-oxo-dGTP pyrophosphatase MutT (NUDIX family)